MANTITRTNPTDSRSGTRNVIWVEGRKYAGTAEGGATTYLYDSALSGVAEENIVESGTSDASTTTYYDGAGTRNIIYEAGQNFRTTCMRGMTLVRNDTGAIHNTDIRGPYHNIRLRIGAAFPVRSEEHTSELQSH